MSLYDEIHEQPARLAGLLSELRAAVESIAREIRERDVSFAFVAARGTSDNAARYANYLWGARNGMPIALATPSLFSVYHQPPRLKNALVVGVSQSGQSPDIVSVLAEGRKQGCLTLAITNTPDSPLAETAELVLELRAGPERSIAATKTYTAELMALAMLSAAMNQDESDWQALARLPGWMDDALMRSVDMRDWVLPYRDVSRCVVLGRGFNYATVFEWALKLKELTYVEAEPYSTADFQHGPIAMIEEGFPVLAVLVDGPLLDPTLVLLRSLREDAFATLAVISNSRPALDIAHTPIPLPEGMPEWITPLAAIVPAQLFVYHLARAKGIDPDRPRLIRKVTETR
jgi:glucosamine--fructose-6-phosphate aminotransferase (isomerizing)